MLSQRYFRNLQGKRAGPKGSWAVDRTAPKPQPAATVGLTLDTPPGLALLHLAAKGGNTKKTPALHKFCKELWIALVSSQGTVPACEGLLKTCVHKAAGSTCLMGHGVLVTSAEFSGTSPSAITCSTRVNYGPLCPLMSELIQS